MSSPTALPDDSLARRRTAMLLRQAPLEFARAVYGINDLASGRSGTYAAQDVARAEGMGVLVTRERVQQRARSYLPVEGREHCPRCWVFAGARSPLALESSLGGSCEVARCGNCGGEYPNP